MKIAMLIDTSAYGGGAERQFAGLASALYRRGYDIKVWAYHKNNEGYQTDFEHERIDFEILNLGHASRLKKLMVIRKRLQTFRPDVVITYKDGANSIACIIRALGSRWKLIVSDRNTLQHVSRAIKIQYRLLYRFASFIVPNSYAQKKFIDSNFPHLSEKVKVITNFTDTDMFRPKNEVCSTNRNKTILVVARITEQKNVKRFIEVARQLAEKWRGKARIIWYGNTSHSDAAYAEECKELLEKYGLQDFIEFRGKVRDIDRIYRESDMFCLPSLYEGFPNALCEAMASGIVVAASRICDNERILEDGRNGLLFDPMNMEDIEAKLDAMLEMPEIESARLIANARKYVVNNMSISAFTDKYISLIERCAE